MTERHELCILVLEDSPLDAFLLREGLSRLPARPSLLQAERLEEALGLLRENSPDVVLTDLNLPDSFGLDTLRAVVQAAGEVPVVVLLGDNVPEVREQLAREGASGCIAKNELNSGVLTEVIEQVLHL